MGTYAGMLDTDTAAFTGERQPWHAKTATVITDNVMSAREAIAIAGLDWQVERHDVGANVDGTYIRAAGKKALVRSDTNTVLSIMSENYHVVQNAEAFGFVDDVLGGPDLRFNAAGSLHGGKRIWLSAVLDRELYIGGDMDEKVDPYIMFANSHDGSLAVSAWITPIRIACQNALTYSRLTAKRSWKARHTKNVMDKQQDAREMLALASRYFDDLQTVGDALINTKVSVFEMHRLIAELFPMPGNKRPDEVEDGRAKTMVLNRREAVMDCLGADDLANVKDTAWGFVQAVADWDDHHRHAKNDDIRIGRMLFNKSNVKDRALDMARVLANA